MPQQNTTVINRTCVLEGIEGCVHLTDRWRRKDVYNGLPPDFRTSVRVGRCLDALQVLQLKRDQYLFAETLAVPLQFLHDSLPYIVQPDVNIFRPEEADVWSIPLNGDPDSLVLGDFPARHEELMKSRRYHFWPIDVSQGGLESPPHWVLLVIHLLRHQEEEDDTGSPHDPLTGPYNFLDSYAVIDADHGKDARDAEDKAASLLQHVLPKMGITVDTRSTRENPWVPPSRMNAPQVTPDGEKEDWSSGLRVFEMIRIWLDRLTESYCYEPHSHDQTKFWAPHPGWVNLDAVRSNMIGMAATMVNRSMNSTTRIAIEPIIDGALQIILQDQAIPTQTMMPNRERLGVFVPGQPRRHPTWIDDAPTPEEEEVEADADAMQDDAAGEGPDEDEDATSEQHVSDGETLQVVAKRGRSKRTQGNKRKATTTDVTATKTARKRRRA